MANDAPDAPAPPPQPAPPAGPVITAVGGRVLITGAGFLPNHSVTVRITRAGDDIADYLTYTTDADGRLSATLPPTAVAETAQIAASDHRPDPHGDHGLLWSNTVTVADGA
ncbi:hypothetical protein [Mycobacterium talmoniae]|uniref:IPT/TIG domain-containing protein n=1 Tax=Mycobacterium talmoniae TaxID=1858794 RepID=A0A1S1NE19_9MYCO|nr:MULTISPECIES: hypothetical protein [Mycobacterium]OHU99558.1 hypothetical protein BKN37_19100 [Mycobacterium talmoniae]PQM49491.1 hypothetical protein C1Y40_00288 [Mycobacterium talmoniae]TDH47551.1 hypothetical protein E2F47_26300 [Mycobacterium eburneum]